METLIEIARRLRPERGSESKDYPFYDIYESYLAPLRDQPLTILELGVLEGESTRVLAEYFPAARIIGVDMKPREIDFSVYAGRVTYHEANQTDGAALAAILDACAPEGVNVVIDDASHVGYFSKISFYHVFRRLVCGGLYVVEDWTTGYRPEWDDGGPHQTYEISAAPGVIPRLIPSHTFGMVGFVKWLVDLLGSSAIGGDGAVVGMGINPVDYLHIYPCTAILKKSQDLSGVIFPA